MGLTPDNSGVAGSAIPTNRGNYMAIAAFTAVAWYNILELNISVFFTFKRHRGLYFWSLLISGYGCVLHALGFLLKFFQLTNNNYVSVTIITIGWYAMVTGQAVVLYSRLHLVVREQKILRAVLAMIIVDAICFHIPSTVLTYGANTKPAYESRSNKYLSAFNVVEKLQMTAFCIQEFIISGVYVWSTIRLLRPVYHGRTRKVMMQLIEINLIIIAMDVVLLAMEYSNIYFIEATLKAMVYSIKLKLEFAVLNQLMTLANSSVNSNQVLHIEESDKANKPPAGRSKSTEYISHKYEKPKKDRTARAKELPPVPSATPTSPSQHPRSASFGAFGKPASNSFSWVPALDRNHFVEAKHVENVARQASKSDTNYLNNPAAHFSASRKMPRRDKYGEIEEEEEEKEEEIGSITSPTLTGTTIHALSPQSEPPVQSIRTMTSRGGRRRATPPPSLSLANAIMPNGLIRSNRPSVSEWGRGPDGDASPESDEIQLNPCDQAIAPPRSPGSVRAGRQRAKDCQGMDFVTSAL